jgi:2-polyprenyl-3-methyl-5-hydroxy-6-metoxy-1,4-benzoquinol methylase
MRAIEESNTYKMLADEYYDSVRHPTCANFRDASEQLIKSWLDTLLETAPVCEIGCGMSLLAEMYRQRGVSLKNVYLTDSTPHMLAYSDKWRSAGAHLLLADAAELPFSQNSITACVASLGDPYNRPTFWNELSRIMMHGSYAVFTTPSFEWAAKYRLSAKDGSTEDSAAFLLADGGSILTPSIIHPSHDQVSMIERVNGLKVVSINSIVYSQLRSMEISHKLLVVKDQDQPVVTGYLVQKQS